jgi:CDP-diacylglycerol---glycerol-3-phosphate 3-phosphatidyltransferase
MRFAAAPGGDNTYGRFYMLDKPEIKDRARQIINPLIMVIARTGLTPNMLTIIGVALNGVVGLIIAAGYTQLGGILLIFTSFFDMLDGALAKATGRGSKFGAFLDSTLDRYSESLVLLGLLWLSIERSLTADIMLIFLTIVGSLMVSYTRARAEGLGLDCRVGLLGRPERIAILAAGLILNLVTPALLILAIFTNLTAVQRMIHVYRTTGGK